MGDDGGLARPRQVPARVTMGAGAAARKPGLHAPPLVELLEVVSAPPSPPPLLLPALGRLRVETATRRIVYEGPGLLKGVRRAPPRRRSSARPRASTAPFIAAMDERKRPSDVVIPPGMGELGGAGGKEGES